MEAEIQARIERLYENEALTDNLTDGAARTLLHWAEQQLCDNADETLVTAAVSFANSSDSADPHALVVQAQSYLSEQLRAHETDSTPPVTNAAAEPEQIKNPPPQSVLTVSGASGAAAASDARLTAEASVATAPPVKKKRRAGKRKIK